MYPRGVPYGKFCPLPAAGGADRSASGREHSYFLPFFFPFLPFFFAMPDHLAFAVAVKSTIG